jgi:DNA topoisomerase II
MSLSLNVIFGRKSPSGKSSTGKKKRGVNRAKNSTKPSSPLALNIGLLGSSTGNGKSKKGGSAGGNAGGGKGPKTTKSDSKQEGEIETQARGKVKWFRNYREHLLKRPDTYCGAKGRKRGEKSVCVPTSKFRELEKELEQQKEAKKEAAALRLAERQKRGEVASNVAPSELSESVATTDIPPSSLGDSDTIDDDSTILTVEADEGETVVQDDSVMDVDMTFTSSKKPRVKRPPPLKAADLFTMGMEDIDYCEVFYNTFKEVLENALDRQFEDETINLIEVTIDRETGWISVRNTGEGIPVTEYESKDPETGKMTKHWTPEVVFTKLWSGSNFDDSKKRYTGGRNGMGVKITIVFAKEAHVVTADTIRKKRFRQSYRDNMSSIGKPSIAKHRSSKGFTEIRYLPDYEKMGIPDGMSDTDEQMLIARVLQAASCSHKRVRVKLNGVTVPVANVRDLASTFEVPRSMLGLPPLEKDELESEDGTSTDEDPLVKPDPKLLPFDQVVNKKGAVVYQVCALPKDTLGKHDSMGFVNSIVCNRGTHVSMARSTVEDCLKNAVKRSLKDKNANVSFRNIRSRMFLIVNAVVDSPTFGGQTKEELSSSLKVNWKGDRVAPVFLRRLVANTGVVARVTADIMRKDLKSALKDSGMSRGSRYVVSDKYKQAKYKGRRHCTLYLCEGQSAMASLLSAFSVMVGGGNTNGALAFKGNPMNVRVGKEDQKNIREKRIKAMLENPELKLLCKVLNLRYGVKQSIKDLSYQCVVVFSDQDVDGAHILGLVYNFFSECAPWILEQDKNFIRRMPTPIVRLARKRGTAAPISFYSLPSFRQWGDANPEWTATWNAKYYKGLGTSVNEEVQEYFEDRSPVAMAWTGPKSRRMIEDMFEQKRSHRRKELIRNVHDPDASLDYTLTHIPIERFMEVEGLQFSVATVVRAIPSVVDGWKPSQRKIMHTFMSKSISKDLKVNVAGSRVTEATMYHHGEKSLNDAIVRLAQGHWGTNNINLLVPSGQFGSRLSDREDHAAVRYISTRLEPITSRLFPKADEVALRYLEDEGHVIEPEHYAPILPTTLINGARGVATGWKSTVPCHNPMSVAAVVEAMLKSPKLEKEENLPSLTPWYRGFRGTIEKMEEGDKYVVRGVYRIEGTVITITELPVGTWTNKYKKFLEQFVVSSAKVSVDDGKKKDTKKQKNKYGEFIEQVDDSETTDLTVHLVLHCKEGAEWDKVKNNLVSVLGLEKSIDVSDMNLIDAEGNIKCYKTVYDIIRDFFRARRACYIRRKEILSQKLRTAIETLRLKRRFILTVISGNLELHGHSKKELCQQLEDMEFPPLPPAGPIKQLASSEDNGGSGPDSSEPFGYLLGMRMWSLTEERQEQMKAEIAKKKAELKTLETTRVEDMWLTDIEAFKSEYPKYEERRRKLYEGKVSRKRKRPQTGSSKGGSKVKRSKLIVTEWVRPKGK